MSDLKAFKDFMKAVAEAEEKGEHDFKCPLCGGRAWVKGNVSGCLDCGFRVIE